MSAADLDRALLARQTAALLRRGWPAGRALALVADAMPEGPARDRLRARAAALQGGTELAPDADPLSSLLVRGEQAGPEALEQAVRGFELSGETSRLSSSAFAWMAWTAAALFAASLAADAAVRSLAGALVFSGAPILGAVWLSTMIAGALPWLAGLALVAVLLLRKGVLLRTPGLADLQAASRLHLVAAGLRAGLDEAAALALADPAKPASLAESRALALDASERGVLARMEALGTRAQALAMLAEARQAAGRRRWERFLAAGPSVAFLVAVGLAALVAAGIFSPLFAIAGPVR